MTYPDNTPCFKVERALTLWVNDDVNFETGKVKERVVPGQSESKPSKNPLAFAEPNWKVATNDYLAKIDNLKSKDWTTIMAMATDYTSHIQSNGSHSGTSTKEEQSERLLALTWDSGSEGLTSEVG
jgi:hypothetical protein